MKGTITLICVAVITAGMALAAIPLGDWEAPEIPGIDATGGPDLYGYTWIDSNEPGGPALNWIDIRTTGTLVDGLGDDNWVGPFSIGFPFHYYWYDVDQYYIGSNGYLKFGTPYNMAQPFPASIPLASAPNDFIGVYIADWYPGQNGQGSVYQWTNNADSLIVAFYNIPEWTTSPTAGSHTFEVILTDTDSSITFQYMAQTGTVSNNDMLIGIENNNGQVGLEHSHDTYAPSNYVIRYEYPPSTSYVVHDMAVVSSANENSEGFFVLNGDTVTPWAKVKNSGNQTETTFEVRCLIESEGGIPSYYQLGNYGPLNPGEELEITFTPNWTPTTNEQYFFEVTVDLPGDMNPANDEIWTEVHVLDLPGILLYDDGSSEQSWSWMGGNGGLGQRFVPPTYPVMIDDIKYYIAAGSASLPFEAKIHDDDGVNGLPGTELFSQQLLAPTSNQWYTIDLTSQNIEITEGAYYVSWHMTAENSTSIGTDSSYTQIGSRQSWEYTGVWAPFRNAETHDVMIRTSISEPGSYPNFDVDLTYVSGPGGGALVFDAYLANNSGSAQDFDAWLAMAYEGGQPNTLVLRSFTNYLSGWAINRPNMFYPMPTPTPGSYTMYLRVGEEPSIIWAEDFFTFEVTGSESGGSAFPPPIPESLRGIFDIIDKGEAVQTVESAELKVCPNPFNPVTAISYQLSAPSLTNLTVYNVHGRLVATLVNGTASGKMVLMK